MEKRSYDDDMSKKYGFQSQIQSSNPSTNPNWSDPAERNMPMPPSAPLAPAPVAPPLLAPAPPVAGTYVGPHFQATNQMPRRDKVVECARCSICFIMFGVFLTITGIVMLSTAKNFDVHWLNPQPVNPMRIIGPIALSIGIPLLILACVIISIAKHRVRSNPTVMAANYGGPTPVISGRLDNNDSAVAEFSDHPPAIHAPPPQTNHYGSTAQHDSPPSYDAVATTTNDHKPFHYER